MQRALTITSAGYAVPENIVSSSVLTEVKTSPEIMMQPIVSNSAGEGQDSQARPPQSEAAVVYPNTSLTGQAFGFAESDSGSYLA